MCKWVKVKETRQWHGENEPSTLQIVGCMCTFTSCLSMCTFTSCLTDSPQGATHHWTAQWLMQQIHGPRPYFSSSFRVVNYANYRRQAAVNGITAMKQWQVCGPVNTGRWHDTRILIIFMRNCESSTVSQL